MISVLKTRDHGGNTVYREAGGTLACGSVTNVGRHYTVTTYTADRRATSYVGYVSLANAERFAERLLVAMGYIVYVPLGASTPEPAPTPEPAANSVEVAITQVASECYHLKLTCLTDIDTCNQDKKIVRIGKATLTFHD